METPFDRITHAMAETSSRPEDLEWAHTAYGYLINGDVKPATAESAVLKVVREIEAGEKSAQDIHGDAILWAHRKIRAWVSQNTEAFTGQKLLSFRQTLSTGFFFGAGVSVLFWLIGLLPSDRGPSPQALGFFLLPLFLGFGVLILPACYARGLRQFGFRGAVLASGLVFIGLSFGIAGILTGFETLTDQTYPAWTHLPAAALFALCGAICVAILPDSLPREPKPVDLQNDRAWAKLCAQTLRTRGDISDPRIREELSRVQEHCAATGARAIDEFGHPVAYAFSLSGQKLVKPHRLYLYSLLMVALTAHQGYWLVTTDDTSSLLWRVPLLALVSVVWALELRKNYRAYRQVKA